MGLDMYLSASEYVGGWDYGPIEEQERYRMVLGSLGKNPKDLAEGSPHLTVEYSVAYWRKANAVHAWFVDNVQNGVDECQKAYVDREKLVELRDLAQSSLLLKEPAPGLTPRAGFFFGSTDIDEWYWNDIQSTVDQLTKVLENPAFKHCEFYYQSSW